MGGVSVSRRVRAGRCDRKWGESLSGESGGESELLRAPSVRSSGRRRERGSSARSPRCSGLRSGRGMDGAVWHTLKATRRVLPLKAQATERRVEQLKGSRGAAHAAGAARVALPRDDAQPWCAALAHEEGARRVRHLRRQDEHRSIPVERMPAVLVLRRSPYPRRSSGHRPRRPRGATRATGARSTR